MPHEPTREEIQDERAAYHAAEAFILDAIVPMLARFSAERAIDRDTILVALLANSAAALATFAYTPADIAELAHDAALEELEAEADESTAH